MADTLSRPPGVAAVPEPATTKSVKVPYGLLVGSQVTGVAAGANYNPAEINIVAQANVPAEQLPVSWREMAAEQQLCTAPRLTVQSSSLQMERVTI